MSLSTGNNHKAATNGNGSFATVLDRLTGVSTETDGLFSASNRPTYKRPNQKSPLSQRPIEAKPSDHALGSWGSAAQEYRPGAFSRHAQAASVVSGAARLRALHEAAALALATAQAPVERKQVRARAEYPSEAMELSYEKALRVHSRRRQSASGSEANKQAGKLTDKLVWGPTSARKNVDLDPPLGAVIRPGQSRAANANLSRPVSKNRSATPLQADKAALRVAGQQTSRKSPSKPAHRPAVAATKAGIDPPRNSSRGAKALQAKGVVSQPARTQAIQPSSRRRGVDPVQNGQPLKAAHSQSPQFKAQSSTAYQAAVARPSAPSANSISKSLRGTHHEASSRAAASPRSYPSSSEKTTVSPETHPPKKPVVRSSSYQTAVISPLSSRALPAEPSSRSILSSLPGTTEEQIRQLIDRLNAMDRDAAAEDADPVESYAAPAEHVEHRSETISVRMNEEEFAALRHRAAESGLSVSAYMRSCVLEADHLREQVRQTMTAMRAAALGESASDITTPFATDQMDNTEPVRSESWWRRFRQFTGNLVLPSTGIQRIA